MEHLTIGQMAERNCVSRKTLRLYHDLGLLVPEYVDESNGRRYYNEDQRYVLDAIQRLQAIGMSLSEINEAVNETDAEELKKLLEHQLELNRQKQVSLGVAMNTNRELLEGIRMRMEIDRRPHALPSVQIQECEAFPMLVFTCEELGIPPITYGMHPDCLDQWYRVMDSTKRMIAELVDESGIDVPIPLLFHRVGVVNEKDDHDGRVRYCRKVFIGIDAALADVLKRSTELPAGTYLTLGGECTDMVGMCSGQCMTKVCMDRLFEFAEKHRFKTDGMCYTECLPDPLALRSSAVETLNRTRLRILEE
ncbi:MerR family transcriptional regulator [Slackia heliotrinireducens]|uniref:Predicted transcriptional regulator n=1 Tax=Slackia heliotrinireducens (strain ATCC 29202 / DSM 20476 / NCTC 11029 / RHS 1) TaxID=471855 RepID=C7N710_SLAHD|nr:MerR family transcriptional regulator [Slackia heliotrinireducens]ACV22695.1 predicted transcriptional regulator [Slackia heliotrinireducens DSM 20476]